MTQQKQMTEQELDQISGGPNRNPYAQYVESYKVFGNKKYTNSNGWSIRAGKWVNVMRT